MACVHGGGSGSAASLGQDGLFGGEEEERRAFSKIVRLAASRELCASRARQRLARDGFDGDAAERAVRRACACGLIDDRRYADAFVRSRLAQGRGRAGIERELASCAIDVADLPGWPDEYFPVEGPDEAQRAYECVARNPPRSKNPQAAACQKLLARGFSYDAAFAAARRYARGCQEDPQGHF